MATYEAYSKQYDILSRGRYMGEKYDRDTFEMVLSDTKGSNDDQKMDRLLRSQAGYTYDQVKAAREALEVNDYDFKGSEVYREMSDEEFAQKADIGAIIGYYFNEKDQEYVFSPQAYEDEPSGSPRSAEAVRNFLKQKAISNIKEANAAKESERKAQTEIKRLNAEIEKLKAENEALRAAAQSGTSTLMPNVKQAYNIMKSSAAAALNIDPTDPQNLEQLANYIASMVKLGM